MIFLNNNYVEDGHAVLDVRDRGLLLADGLFETIRVYSGKISHFSLHFERFQISAKKLQIPLPFSSSELEHIIQNLIVRNELQHSDAAVRMTLTRGVGPRGLLLPLEAKPTLLITTSPYVQVSPKEYSLYVGDSRRNQFSMLSNIKSLNYLDQVMTRLQAVEQGFDDCLMLNMQGNIVCTSAANIFLYYDGALYTPPLSDGVLPGIARKIIQAVCYQQGILCREESITPSLFKKAEEVFISNVLIEMQVISRVGGQFSWTGRQNGMYQRIHALYKECDTVCR